MKHLTFFLLIIFSCLLTTSDSYALPKTASANGNWNSTATWGGQEIPTSSDDVTINEGIKVTVTADAFCNSLAFTAGATSNSTVSINSGIILTVSGAITIQRAKTGITNILTVGAGTLNAGSINFIDGAAGGKHLLKISTGTVNVSGDVTQHIGADISFSDVGTLNLGGEIFNSGFGTLTTHEGCTINYNGTKDQIVQNFLYENLVISGTGTKTLAQDVTIQGNLKIENGAALFVGNNNYGLVLHGDFTNNGTLIYGTGTVEFVGTSGHVLGGNTATTFYNLIVYDTAGVTLGNNEIVGDTLKFIYGKIKTGTNTLTLGTSISSLGLLIPSELPSSPYIIGNFERWFPNTTNSGMVWFPVGTATSYRPAGIQFTSASSGGKILVAGYNTDPGTNNIISNLIDGTYTIDRYSKEAWWQVTPTGLTGGTYNISLGAYNISGVSPSNLKWLRVLKRADANSDWGFQGVHANAYGIQSQPIVNRTGLSEFSQFGIGGNSTDGNVLNDSPLPVSLASFTSNVFGRNINLKWLTISEINNSGFDIERKGFSGEFVKVGFVQGKGTVSTPSSYEFSDRNLISGKYSYRLKQIDNNGNFEYYSLNGDVVVGVPSKFDLSQNYPNPFNPSTKINFDMPKDGLVSLKIYDMLGREVATLVNEIRTAGYYTVDFNASSLSSGIYFYRINAGEFTSVKKMVVLK